MAVIVLRSVKGSPLTIAEADANFSNLNSEVGQKLDATAYTAADVLTKLKTVDGTGSGLDADFLDGLTTSSTDTTGNTVVTRTNGNFSANVITASLTGNVTGNVIGNLTGTVTGNATNVNGVVAITNGGTGATSIAAARTAFGLDTMALQSASNVSITGGAIALTTALAIGSGGTGANNAASARVNLGLVIGSDVQAYSATLSSFAALATTGIMVRTGTGTSTTRSITAGTNISITNADGLAGNITVTGSQTPTVTSIIKSGTSGAGDIGQSTNRFGTLYGTSTSALYADLAERYTTDIEYGVGTVIVVSLDESGAEGTQCFQQGQRVLGVVSEKPAYLMNGDAPGQALALRGRVPVKVAGPVKKGQALIAGQDGNAIVGDTQNSFAIALHSSSEVGVKLVECVIL